MTPTLFDALGLPAPSGMQGRSFWAGMQGQSAAPRTEIFAEKTFHTYYEPMRAIRTERYKLIVNFEVSTRVDVPSDIRQSPIYPLMLDQFDDVRPTVELYDLRADRWERDNLAGRPEFLPVELDLRQRLRAWMESTQDPLLHGPVASPYYGDALTALRQS
jgi:arylsulfatase A-like enzyme